MEINIKKLEKVNLNSYQECFQKNGVEKKVENLDWLFFQNTERRSFVNLAYDNNQIAAIYASTCVRFLINGEIKQGTQSLDTLTDESYRGQGLFIKLAKIVFNDIKEANIPLIYGFPNGNSIHGFEKKLDWINLDPVPFLIRPLHTKYFTNKLRFLKRLPNINLFIDNHKDNFISHYKNFKISLNNEFPIEVNDLWTEFSKNFKVSVHRDKAYLDWRYINKPNENYQIFHCNNNSGEYLGYIVFCLKEKHDGRIGYIMELVYNPLTPKVGKLLLSAAINHLKSSSADCILSWCFQHSPNYKIFRKKLFFSMPERIRPIELHFAVRAFDKTLIPLLKDRKNWYLSYSDSDTV